MSETVNAMNQSNGQDKRALLARLLREKASRPKHFAASFAQQRLWLVHQFEPSSPVYHMIANVRLRGDLDLGALKQAFTEITRRHESLRTTFAEINGDLMQVVHPAKSFDLQLVDLVDLPAGVREAEARRVVSQSSQVPFDLSAGPLLRGMLVRLEENEHILLLTMHHIVSDGWSMNVFAHEVGVLYQAFSNGLPSPLAELPIQYADYSRWQREHLSGAGLEKHLDYWRTQLDGELPLLELPADRPRPAVRSLAGSNCGIVLSKALSEQLRALSRSERVTMFMLMLAVFKTLLYRYSGQPDIVVGTPTSGRERIETESLIGFFINTVVMRSDLSDNPTFREFLRRTREVALGAYAHQEMPFDKLVDELQVERSLSHSPIFQVVFDLHTVTQNSEGQKTKSEGLKWNVLESDKRTARFDLTLDLTDNGECITGFFEYRTDMFDEATIERMRSHFQNLLKGICADPDTRVQELSLLSEEESRRLLCDFNPPAPVLPPAVCMHQLFEKHADRSPESPALSFDGFHLSYGKVNERANRLAHHLRSLGVGPEDRIGVMLDRTPDLVIAILGILKAGAAYLPLDPAYPHERLSYMLEDAGARVVVTEQALVERWLLDSQASLVCLDDQALASAASTNLTEVGVRSENAAYVIYTSGSTGRPKGVVVTHENVWRLMEVTRADFQFDERDVWTLFHSVSFDFSVWELWGPLAFGGRLVVVPYWVSREPEAFYELLKEEGVTVLNQTPSAFRQLMKVDEAVGAELALRSVIFGGEALEMSTLRGWFERHGDERPRLVNMYGITETTVHVTYRALKASDTEGGSVIGGPLGDLDLYVLDQQMRAVPEGVTGELYVGGSGVARGYLGRAELTAQRFVPHPYSERAGARLYRTGDLARRRADGELEYLGRIDEQVKIRGFRIELGEIANALREQACVRECVVLALGENGEEKRLVAYVVADQEGVNAGELREELKQRLPEHMIPSAIVLLAEMPLTRNGKVDRRALPAPEEVTAEVETNFVAPRTPVEEVLAGIWCEVLRTTRVGVHDNFFALGGHSLLATQVVSRIREAFGVEIPVRVIFEKQTLAMHATEVEQLMYQGGSLQAPPVVPTSRDVELPLSFAQQRLWFIDRLTPESPLYNMPMAVRLDGALNLVALERTLREIVRRHEVLRTNIVTVAGKPVQVIRPEAEVDQFYLPLVDLISLPEAVREAEMRRLAHAEAVRPFNLETDALLRSTVLRLDDQQHIAMLTFHHIIFDGWSTGVFVSEVAALYNAFSQGLESPLAELPVQYADYAVWQREWLQGEVLDQQIGYWKRQLEGAPELLELPTDRPRPAVQTNRGATVGMALSPELTAKLREMCRAEGTTLFMLLLAVFKVLLARYTGQEDISVGTPIAGRNRVETEGLIGFFVNTLVLRTDLSGKPTVRELIRRVREVALGAYAHQELPFEKLVDELQVERSLSHAPLFQVVFQLQNAGQEVLELSGLSLSAVGGASGIAKFDLTLSMSESDEAISGALQYNTDLFDETTIKRMVGHFEMLLESFVSDPAQRVSQLQMLTSVERQRTLSEWSKGSDETAAFECLQDLFEAHVERTPDAIAVVFDEQEISYRELNNRANQLAHYLQGQGVREESLVGILVERSVEMLVGVLGVLKAGAAYLPLDPSYPQERLSFMIADAAVEVLLTQQHLIEKVTSASIEACSFATVCLDSDWPRIAEQSTTNPARRCTAANAAYVIYTSGSTGKPKGVVVTHEGAANLAESQRRVLDVQPGTRVLQRASLSFDASVWELLVSVMCGATLCVPKPETQLIGDALYEVLQQQSIELALLTPTVMATVESDGLPCLRTLVTGAEACPAELAARWSAGRRLVNAYGPTEITVIATMSEALDGERQPPIGRPIANMQAYVLDKYMQPVAVGVVGELYVGGLGVTRGYLRRPELTAEKFVPNPFSERGGERLYRTGDVCRHREDGTLEYVGRIDEQVKVRGFRIELGEIETVLAKAEGIAEAVVVAREQAGEKRLVAYLVGEKGSELSVAEVRKYLSGRLPDYMVPGSFVVLEEMPLTANGKIDKKRLPEPTTERPSLASLYVEPQTETERTIAAIFKDLLHLSEVGKEDNFFELGGHSLLATQVVSRIREAFNIEIPVRAVFEKPAIAMLAAEVDQLVSPDGSLQAPPVVRTSRDVALPLSFAQQRLWFIDRLTPGSPLYNMPFAVRLDGVLNLDALERTVREIVRRHEVLRTGFVMVDDQPVQVIRPEAHVDEIRLPLIDLRLLPEGLREVEARRLARAEAARPFDLETGALMRTTVLRLDESQHIALLTFHHITFDGWSMGVFVREVAALYNAFSQGLESPLPELPVQYGDYAVWQREWLQGEVLEQHIDYWKQQLAGAPELLELPTDRPRPAVQTNRGARVGMALSRELTAKLREVCRAEGVTLFMLLLTVFKVFLARYTGQDDISVGTPIAGRNRVETEGLIGFFVNTLVLRTDLSGNPTVHELIRRVREVALGAYAHQELPFEKLVDELQVERSLSHMPLFQVLFALQNSGQEVLELPGLSLSAAGDASDVVKFDLALRMGESEDAIRGVLEYNTDLFDETTIKRLVGYFETLLESFVSDPGQRLWELQMLTEVERERTLAEWSQGSVSEVSECIQEMFSQSAARHRDNPAIIYQDKQYTYGELEDRANTIANYLIDNGAQKGSLVGILAKDSFHVISSIIGILKAGCVFVPFDRQLPQQRLSAMISLVAPEWFMIESRFWPILSSATVDAKATVICVDGDAITSGEQHLVQAVDYKDYCNPEKPSVEPEADDMAYIYFTSGSTGQPKAIAGRLQGIDHFIRWEQEALGVGEGVRVSRLLPISFDGSLRDIFLPLCSGGIAVGPPSRETVLHARKLVEWLEEHEINVIHCVPSLFRSMVNENLTPERLPSLKYILMAGEPLLPADVARWMDVFEERIQLINLYGTSETTMAKFFYFVQPADRERASIPVGKPMPGANAVLVNVAGEPSAPGTIGEVYIRTPYRSLGYYKQAELTRAAFVEDPFGSGELVHKTGDLARQLEDGNYEYLGRKDQQVKIRGIRVELDEIENSLRGYEGVRDVAVIDRDDANGFKYLCAYVVSEIETSPAELRDHLAKYLPEYMLPSSFVPLPELPRTISGKLDRRALPAPGESRLGGMYVAPRTPVEEILAGIWSDVLRTSGIGSNDNFFELGGHSLLAMGVVSRIRDAFGVELFVRAIFEKQTLSMLAAEVERLMSQGSLQSAALVRRSREAELPLSFAQQRLWFIDRFEPGSAVYNMPMAVRLDGTLNLDALERTLREIVRRHEILRTNIVMVEGQPVQVIRSEAQVEEIGLPLIDLSALPEAIREVEVKRLARAEAVRPFDLETDLLLRASVQRLTPQQHIALLTFHHIIFDGWSMGVFVKEVVALYNAFSQGLSSPLPELPVQYADYAVWQREWLQGEVLDQQIGYWKQQLDGAPELLELPADRPRPAVQTHRGARVGMALSPELTAKVRELCRAEGATLFMLLLAVYKVLLARYTGQEDISVGTPIAGRNRVETEGLIGFFVNTLVLRTDLSGNPTVRELLRRVREVALGAYAHQELPFEKLVDELQVERSLSHTPLFQVVFVLQNTSEEVLELPGLSLSAAGAAGTVAKFDLTLNVSESDDAIRALIEYNTDLFDETTIKRLAGHFETLLESFVSDSGQRLSELQMLTEAEQQRTLELSKVSDEAMVSKASECLQELFEAQVERTPEAIALVFAEQQIPYRELNSRANQLAHHLQSLGVGPEDRVAVMLDRTPDLVVAILGILKAGAAYLPLDPSYPQERRSFMLNDAGAQLLVTEQALVEPWLLQQTELTLVHLDDEAVAAAPSSNLVVGVRPENAAYVIYTSGSTGQPKGVVVTHENVWRLMEVTRADFAFDERDVWTLFHSVCFDFSVWELWGPLAHGGRLVVVPYWVSREPEAFYKLLIEEGVTVLNQTPSAFRQLMKVDETIGAELPLRVVIFGGEALEMSTLGGWFERHGDQRPRLVNMYGITETTVHVTYRELCARDTDGGSVIGGALKDLELYVLDQHMRTVPEGVSGELYVGGSGVARGYLGRAELTAQRFVPHPYSEQAGARLYRTGDLARRRADGELEYVGRIDEQVKIRGFRIELGEIANALREQAAVRECVVLAVGEGGEEKRIVAYVVPEQEDNAGELRAGLKNRLPDYMLPSAIVMLKEMPLTANGKVDRKKLLEAEKGSRGADVSYVAPRTPVEEIIAEIFIEVLSVERVGIFDNFFDLGGHSLLVTLVVSRLREVFHVELPLRAVFEHPNVADLSLAIAQSIMESVNEIDVAELLVEAA